MSENYVIKVDKLRGYQNTLKGEHTNFTNGVRNPFSRGYFYDCSDSAIVTMRNKIADYMSKIDKGYNNIDSWLDKYMQEFTNVEYSLKNGTVRGIYDHDTNMILSRIANKNYVKIEESIDVIYSLKVKTNKTERRKNYDERKKEIGDGTFEKILTIISSAANGDIDLVLEDLYGEHADEYLEISSNLNYYEEYQKTLDTEVKRLEEELNGYINNPLESVASLAMNPGVKALTDYSSKLEGYKEIKAVDELIEEKNKIDEQFNEILKDRASNDKDIQAVLSNQSATYEDLYKVLSEKAKTDSDLNNVLTKKTETDEKFNHLTSTQMKYYLYLSKQAELAAVNKKIIDLRNDFDALQYKVIADTDEYKEFQKTYSIEDSYKQIVDAGATYQYHENDYDWFAYYETYANEGLGLKEAGFENQSLKIGELGAEVDVDVFYRRATDKEKQMYHYLFNTKGAAEANKYVTTLLNRINEEEGRELAEKSQKEIDYYYSGYADESLWYRALSFLASQTKITEKGIATGFNQFNRGIDSCVVTKKVITVDEWKEYYESDYIRELGFGYYYDVVTNSTKMLPGMALGLVATPALGSAIYTASIWGSTHDDAIRSGMSEEDAFWYATLIAGEEFATDLLFKATPGLSKVNWEQSVFKRLLKEMGGEALQSYYERIMDCIYKGAEWDLGEVSEEALYSSLVAAGSFFLTSGPSAIKSANDIVIKYKINGQECEIRGTKGIQKVLIEAGIVDSNFDFDSVSEFDVNLTAADMMADGGKIAEIKITDMSEVTEEKLSKVKYKERVIFTLPDGRMLTFNELQTELGYDGNTSTNETIASELNQNDLSDIYQEQSNTYQDSDVDVFAGVQKLTENIPDIAGKVSETANEAAQNGARALKSLTEKFGLNNKGNGTFKSGLIDLSKLIINNNVGAIKNPFAKLFGQNDGNFEIPTKGLPKWHRSTIKGWDLKIDNEIGNNLHEIMSDEDYVYGVHRTPSLDSANTIYKDGIIMTGDISSGVVSNTINLENNVTMRPGNDQVWDEAMMFHHICESSLYKTYNDIGYGMVVKIPKEYVIFDERGNIKGYDYDKLLYTKDGQVYLKPEFIVAQVEVDNTQILPSENTRFKETETEDTASRFGSAFEQNMPQTNDPIETLSSAAEKVAAAGELIRAATNDDLNPQPTNNVSDNNKTDFQEEFNPFFPEGFKENPKIDSFDFERFFDLDLDVKKTIENSNPMKYNMDGVEMEEQLLKNLEKCERSLNSILRMNGLGAVDVDIDAIVQNIEEKIKDCNCDPKKLQKVYEEYFLSLNGDLENQLEKNIGGWSINNTNSLNTILDNTKSLNEVLHCLHFYTMNSETVYQASNVLDERTDGGNIILRGNDNALARQIYEQVNGLDSSQVDIIGTDNKVLIMVRDYGHALTICIEQEGDQYRVTYNIPKVTNVDLVNQLPGVKKVDSTSATMLDGTEGWNTTNGEFVIKGDDVSNQIINFIKQVPTDLDMDTPSLTEILGIVSEVGEQNSSWSSLFDESNVNSTESILPNNNTDCFSQKEIVDMINNTPDKITMILKEAGCKQNRIDYILSEIQKGNTLKMAGEIYKEQRNIVMNNSPYVKYIDGIKFVSDSEQGLKNLIDYYYGSKNTDIYVDGVSISSGERVSFFDDLSKMAKNECPLTITNIDLGDTSHFSMNQTTSNNPYIFIENSVISASNYSVLYHEGGHYKGRVRDMNHILFNPVEMIMAESDVYNNIKNIYDKYQKEQRENLYQKVEETYKVEIEQKVEERLINDLGEDYKTNTNVKDISEALRNIYTQDYIKEYVDVYNNEYGLAAVDDIFDALGAKVGVYGHGREYYRGMDKCAEEIRANLNALYFAGTFGLIGRFFGEDISNKLKNGVEFMNGIDSATNLVKEAFNHKFDINSQIDESNNATNNGMRFTFNVKSISDITMDDLNKITNPNNVYFRTLDGKVLSYKNVMDMKVKEIEFNNKVSQYENFLRGENVPEDQIKRLVSGITPSNVDNYMNDMNAKIQQLNDAKLDIHQKMKEMGYSEEQISQYLNGINAFDVPAVIQTIDNMYTEYINKKNSQSIADKIATANQLADSGTFSAIDIKSISELTLDDLSKIKHSDMISFRTPDGIVYSYQEVLDIKLNQIEYSNKVSEYENYLRWSNIPEDQIKDVMSKITPDNIDTYINGMNEQLQHLNDSKYDIHQKMKEMGYTEQQISEYLNGLNIFNVFEASNTINNMYQNFVNTNSQNRTIVNKSLKTRIVDFVKRLFGIKNLNESKFTSEQYESRKLDATERMKKGLEITQEDIAYITGDPKQYLYLKYKAELDNAGYLDKPGQMNLNEMQKILKDKLTSQDKEIINAMLSDKESLYNTTDSFTDEEKFYAQVYTAHLGNPISDYLRGIYDTKTKFGKKVYEFDINNLVLGQSKFYVNLEIMNRKDWSGKSYDTVQKELNKKYKEASKATVGDFVKNMDSVIAKSVIKTETVVYRGCDGVYINGNKVDVNSLSPGTRFTDSAYLSTSLDPNVSYVQRNQVCIEITIPEGTHGAYLQSISGASTFNMEEILLGRNTTLEVTGYPEERNGTIYIPVKVVN